VYFVTAIGASGNSTSGVKLAPGAGSWSFYSDRDAKTGYAPVDGRDLLRRLDAVPVQTLSYKSQDPAIRHMGPTAQDFHAAFGLGEDERHISEVDASGVALAAIQALSGLLHEQEAQISALKEQNAKLEARLAALERQSGASPAASVRP
jgi:hypothetical protein